MKPSFKVSELFVDEIFWFFCDNKGKYISSILFNEFVENILSTEGLSRAHRYLGFAVSNKELKRKWSRLWDWMMTIVWLIGFVLFILFYKWDNNPKLINYKLLAQTPLNLKLQGLFQTDLISFTKHHEINWLINRQASHTKSLKTSAFSFEPRLLPIIMLFDHIIPKQKTKTR